MEVKSHLNIKILSEDDCRILPMTGVMEASFEKRRIIMQFYSILN